MQKPSENAGGGEGIKKSNRPGFYAKQGLVVLKMRMSLDQRSIHIYIYMHMACDEFPTSGSQASMARAITSGLGTGSVAAIALKLLDRVDRTPFVDPAAVCSILKPDPSVHWASLVLGLIIGLLIFPICEIILTYRYWVLRCYWERANPLQVPPAPTRQFYRFVHGP